MSSVRFRGLISYRLRVLLAAATLTIATFTLTPRAQAQTCSPTVTLVPIGASIPAVTDIRHARTPRLFLVEQGGRIRIAENGSVLPTPFLDISSIVSTGGESGLLSLAFHPSYPATPWFFVLYTSHQTGGANFGDVRLARYNVSANPNLADPASARVLLTIPHSIASNHNGGQLQFGPLDGYLYLSVGDGGAACDSTGPGCNAQRDDTMLGKLLRIDVNRDTAPFYNVPPSNPFVGPGAPLDEIWAKGLRNPFRISFDRSNGNLWIADVGQSSREEIDFQPAAAPGGRNYGWKIMEGTQCNTCSVQECPLPAVPCNAPQLTQPFHEYSSTTGTSIIGGYVYRGSWASFRGCYVFGDWMSGNIWAIDPASPSVRRVLASGLIAPTTFGEDSAGELYVATNSGVFRLAFSGSGGAATVPASPRWVAALLGAFFALSLQRRRARAASAAPRTARAWAATGSRCPP